MPRTAAPCRLTSAPGLAAARSRRRRSGARRPASRGGRAAGGDAGGGRVCGGLRGQGQRARGQEGAGRRRNVVGRSASASSCLRGELTGSRRRDHERRYGLHCGRFAPADPRGPAGGSPARHASDAWRLGKKRGSIRNLPCRRASVRPRAAPSARAGGRASPRLAARASPASSRAGPALRRLARPCRRGGPGRRARRPFGRRRLARGLGGGGRPHPGGLGSARGGARALGRRRASGARLGGRPRRAFGVGAVLPEAARPPAAGALRAGSREGRHDVAALGRGASSSCPAPVSGCIGAHRPAT